MMKRLIALLPVAVLLVVLALPVSAQPSCTPTPNGNGAATCTLTFKDEPVVMPVTAAGCLPAGTIFWTVNGIVHVTLNKLQDPVPDSWFTGTLTGPFSFVPDGATTASFSGHGTEWFGSENNNKNNVQHFTVNFEGHDGTGGVTKFHINANATLSASGQFSQHFDQRATCG